MKARYIIGLCLSVLLVAGGYFWGGEYFAKNEAVAFYVPQDAVLFVEQNEIGMLIDNVQNSHLGKTLATMDFVQIAKDLGLAEESRESLQQSLKVFNDLINNALFREFCGKTVALAIMPADPKPTAEKKPLAPFQSLLITKPQHKAEILELFSNVFSKDFKQSETQHGGLNIKKLQFDEMAVYAAVIDGYFFFSLDEQAILDARDASRSAESSLAGDQTFQKLKHQLHKPEFMVFCSLEGMRQLLMKIDQQETPTIQKEIIEQLASTSGLMYTAYGIWRDNDLLRDSFITLVDQAKLDPLMAQLLSISPEHNDTLGFVPENILTYYWSNTLALSSMWEMYVEENSLKTAEIESLNSTVIKSTGKEIPEVLALIDNGVSLFLKNGDPKSFIPLPQFAVFFKLKDRQAGEEILRSIIAKYNIPLRSQTYKQLTYAAYDLALPGGLQALYGFQDNFLFISNSSDIMKDITDTRESGNGLQSGETYSRMNIDLEENNNSVCFIRMAELLGGIKDFLGWGSAMLALQDRETAEKSRVVLEGLITPLLDGMTMFSTITTRSRLAKDQIVVESVISLNPDTKPFDRTR